MEKFFKHPWVVIGVIALITVFFALQLPKIQMDNNMTAFMPDDNPARVIVKHFEAEYGDPVIIMVGLQRPYGTVFDSGFLSRIREFSEEVETMGMVKDVTSIMSTQFITSDSESIIVTDLVGENFSGTGEEIAELRRRIASWDLYQGSIVSDDLSSTQVVVKLNATNDHAGDADVVAALLQIRGLAKEMFAEGAEVYTAGQAVVSASLTESALVDIGTLIPLVVAVLLGVLILSFRRFSYVMLPLLAVLVATIWSIGAMPLFGVKLTLLCLVLPVILMAVGSAYGIHVISHYKDELEAQIFTPDEYRQFIFRLVKKLVKPVFLASLTTFAGFISFCFAPLSIMREFGIFASFGVIAALIMALTLIPAILLIRGKRAAALAEKKKAGKAADVNSAALNSALKRGFDFEKEFSGTMTAIVNKKALVLVITALVIAVSILGASKVIPNTSLVEFFNPASEVSRSDKFIREKFGGSTQIIVSVEADSTEALLHPQTLTALD